MPIPFLYTGSTYAPWMFPARDDASPNDAEAQRPMLPNFTQAELRQMVLDVMG